MPISLENAALYPPDWVEISHRIKLRAKSQCECRGECGNEHPAKWCLAHQGRRIDATNPASGTVVLTVAHLDHDPRHCDDANLRAFCQRCHLAYDRELHTRNGAATRKRKKAEAHEKAGQGRLW